MTALAKNCGTPRTTDNEPGDSVANIRPSRVGKRRAAVLIVVQLLMIAHIVQWLVTGSTLTPVEPSEAMETVRDGVVNAGAVFFVVALVVTLVVGRWFCGWGCHLVLLQDACGWFMKKLGIRPKAFRSRFLVYVPFLTAFQMFLWPLVERFVVRPLRGMPPDWPGLHTEFMTEDFWHTFAGVSVAIPFLLICGFATVYFLGAKGFCTYGCPYGGLFAPVDRLALSRIRVTPSCEQCGHCTAVCTSNVKIHDEVREYGMVVDPGCMKCLDCVSVCPNDALYVGWGAPALGKGKPRHKKPKKRYDLTLGEEFVFSGIFAVSYFSMLSAYTLVPALMAAGWAGVATFLAWLLWRTLKKPQVSLHRFRLKKDGRVTSVGWIWRTVAAVFLVFTLHSGVVNGCAFVGAWTGRSYLVIERTLLHEQPLLPPTELARTADAIDWFHRAQPIGAGGLGLFYDKSVDYQLSLLHSRRKEFDQAETVLKRLVENTDAGPAWVSLARVQRAQGRNDAALDSYERSLQADPRSIGVRQELIDWYQRLGRREDALRVTRAGVAGLPNRTEFRFQLGQLLREDDPTEAVALFESVLQLRRKHFKALREISLLLERQGKSDEALPYARRAARVRPEDQEIQQLLGRLKGK